MKLPDKPWAKDEPLEWLFGWCLATVVGTLLGTWFGKQLIILFLDRAFYPAAAIDGLIRGVCMGLGQWWLLRCRLSAAAWWIPVSSVSFGMYGLGQMILTPVSILSGFFGLVSMTLLGGLVGLIQWSYLNSKSTVANWWIAACASAGFVQYLLCSFIGLLDPAAWFLNGLSALIWSGAGGIAMLILLDNLRNETEKPERRFRSLRPSPVTRPKPDPTDFARLTQPMKPSQPAKPTQPVMKPVLPAPTPKPAQTTGVALPNSLELCKQSIAMLGTQEPDTTAAVFDFELPKRPLRARLRMAYAGITKDTQARFRQHVQLNGTVLMELQSRSQDPQESQEYQLRIPETLFMRANRLIVVSRSNGTEHSQNPFRLNYLAIDLDWGD